VKIFVTSKEISIGSGLAKQYTFRDARQHSASEQLLTSMPPAGRMTLFHVIVCAISTDRDPPTTQGYDPGIPDTRCVSFWTRSGANGGFGHYRTSTSVACGGRGSRRC
jgi:hypothetical protein